VKAQKNSDRAAKACQAIRVITRNQPVGDSGPESLGFKAYNLARMAQLGLRVPPAFVLPTSWCFRKKPVAISELESAIGALEKASGVKFGDPRRPLLLSVRSGAPVSMPGMMETLLNIGLNEDTLRGMMRVTGNPRLAYDSYRRLIAGFGEVVAGIDGSRFEADLDDIRQGADERSLDFAALRELASRHLATYRAEAGEEFPQDVNTQLLLAINAVFKSWDSDKAKAYRAMHKIKHGMGTAVTVQQMAFGNSGGLSGAGVGFTRNPSTGEPALWVDFLFNAQGEDVVSGRRSAKGHGELAAAAPSLWRELEDSAARLEEEFGDMQDFEFTIQEGAIYWLQTRSGKRTPVAQARIALDLLEDGLVSRDEAIARTNDLDEEALCVTTLMSEAGAPLSPIATAQTASAGAISGEIALSDEQARRRKKAGAIVILVRKDAETRDVAILEEVDALLTQRGARTSHAAVVARQLGKVCLVGCTAMEFSEAGVRIAGADYREGDVLTLDGNDGAIYAGAVKSRRLIDEALLGRLASLRKS